MRYYFKDGFGNAADATILYVVGIFSDNHWLEVSVDEFNRGYCKQLVDKFIPISLSTAAWHYYRVQKEKYSFFELI